MAKKIRFPLEMENEVQVRTLEELKEHFSIEKVLLYYTNGKLLTWLRDRYYEDIANKIENMDSKDSGLNRKICELFDVEYDEINEVELSEIEEKSERITKLKMYTDDKEVIKNVDKVAFKQDDIYDLLDINETTIYLCGVKFQIPLEKSGITYIGINNPIAFINSKTEVDWNEKEISFQGICFNEEYLSLINNNASKNETDTKKEKKFGKYNDRTYISYMLSKVEQSKAEKMFDVLKSNIKGLVYDINNDTNDMAEIIKKADMYKIGLLYIDKL